MMKRYGLERLTGDVIKIGKTSSDKCNRFIENANLDKNDVFKHVWNLMRPILRWAHDRFFWRKPDLCGIRCDAMSGLHMYADSSLSFRGKVLYSPDIPATRKIIEIANKIMEFPAYMKKLVDLLNKQKGFLRQFAQDTESIQMIKVRSQDMYLNCPAWDIRLTANRFIVIWLIFFPGNFPYRHGSNQPNPIRRSPDWSWGRKIC